MTDPFRARLVVTWRGVPLDTVSLRPGRHHRARLRSGARLEARFPDRDARALEVSVDDGPWLRLSPGCPMADPSGHTLAYAIDAPELAERPPLLIDSHLLQATVITMAVQLCLMGAIGMTPDAHADNEPGAGLPTIELRRLIRVTASAAPDRGRPVFVAQGRAPDEAERVIEPRPAAGRPSRVATSRTREPTVADTLDAIVRSLNNGVPGVELGRTIGDLAQSTARSEQLGAGMGGMLAPRRLLDDGAGSGIVDVGTAQVEDRLRVEPEPPEVEARVRRAPPLIGPVSTADIPDGDVRVGALDPIVRDHIAGAVRARKKSVRYCYETWGLASDPRRQGRLTLELTLLPDGGLEDILVTADERGLARVADCVRDQVGEWYLGAGLVQAPQRLSFPFLLQPAARDR